MAFINKTSKTKNQQTSLENLLSANTLLIIVILLELLLALYLILSQQAQLQKMMNSLKDTASSKLEQVSSIPQEEKLSTTSATLLFAPNRIETSAGQKVETELLVETDNVEKVSVIEGRIKYDPDFIKIDNIITRSTLKEGKNKDDIVNGIYYFSYYTETGQVLSGPFNIATLTVTPLRKGSTTVEFIFEKGSTKGTSMVMRFDNPVNLLNSVEKLDIVIE